MLVRVTLTLKKNPTIKKLVQALYRKVKYEIIEVMYNTREIYW